MSKNKAIKDAAQRLLVELSPDDLMDVLYRSINHKSDGFVKEFNYWLICSDLGARMEILGRKDKEGNR